MMIMFIDKVNCKFVCKVLNSIKITIACKFKIKQINANTVKYKKNATD